ncbi:MAG TPA: hypothetical protein VLH35_08905 [Candidatus Acidoferrales bacterium]|nr:hypothetical protein [Candidatus Acidoferrales bacterium]
MSFVINSIEREDHTGENWLFKGYCTDKNWNVTGLYSTKTKKGWVELVD